MSHKAGTVRFAVAQEPTRASRYVRRQRIITYTSGRGSVTLRLFEGSQLIPDDQVAEYEAGWRKVHCRVEWLRSLHGRLDQALPQTLERAVRNQRTLRWIERETASGPAARPVGSRRCAARRGGYRA